MSWSDYQVNQWLALGTKYLALHYINPVQGGIGLGEVTGGAYARQAVTFQTPQGRATYNNTAVTYTNLPAVTIAYLGIWDAVSGGNYLCGLAVTPTVAVPGGGQFLINPGDIALTFNS